MEVLFLIAVFFVWLFCKAMSKAADRRGLEEAHRLYHLAQARRELERLNREARNLRRDIDQFRDGPGDDIPPGAPDPLKEFMEKNYR